MLTGIKKDRGASLEIPENGRLRHAILLADFTVDGDVYGEIK